MATKEQWEKFNERDEDLEKRAAKAREILEKQIASGITGKPLDPKHKRTMEEVLEHDRHPSRTESELVTFENPEPTRSQPLQESRTKGLKVLDETEEEK